MSEPPTSQTEVWPSWASIFWNWFLTLEAAQKIFFDQFQKANEWRTLRVCSTNCVTVKVTNSVVLTDREVEAANTTPSVF